MLFIKCQNQHQNTFHGAMLQQYNVLRSTLTVSGKQKMSAAGDSTGAVLPPGEQYASAVMVVAGMKARQDLEGVSVRLLSLDRADGRWTAELLDSSAHSKAGPHAPAAAVAPCPTPAAAAPRARGRIVRGDARARKGALTACARALAGERVRLKPSNLFSREQACVCCACECCVRARAAIFFLSQIERGGDGGGERKAARCRRAAAEEGERHRKASKFTEQSSHYTSI